MMYAKYAFAVVMAAVAVRAEEDIKGNSCDSVSSGCGHSSSCRSMGAPSSCCDSWGMCPSDKKQFLDRYSADGKNPATFVAFYPEDIVINGSAASKDEFAALDPKKEGGEAQPFEFYTKTGAFKVTDETASAERQPVKEEEVPAASKLSAGSIVVGWKSTDGKAYLLADPKEATDLGSMIKSHAKNVAGFYVLNSSMNKVEEAGEGKIHSEETQPTDGEAEKPAEGATEGEGEKPAGGDDADKKGSSMMWIIIAIVVVVVIAAAVIGYFVMAGGDDAEEEEETDEEAAEEA